MARKRNHIAETLKEEIIIGKYCMGARLPTRDELQLRFAVSRQTIQDAMRMLLENGFIRTNRSGGTCVSEHPPHLYRIALAAPHAFENSFYTRAICAVATELKTQHEPYFFSYYSLDKPGEVEGDFAKLADDIEQQMVAGLVIVKKFSNIAESPILRTTRQIPIVLLEHMLPALSNAMNFIHMSYVRFLVASLGYLKESGAQRVGLLGSFESCNAVEGAISIMREFGYDQAHLVQSCHPNMPWSIIQTAQLFCAMPPELRPHALIVSDDNMVKTVTDVLREQQSDIKVVAHCNYPMLPEVNYPVKWVGLDCKALLRKALESIVKKLAGQPVASELEFDVKFQ